MDPIGEPTTFPVTFDSVALEQLKRVLLRKGDRESFFRIGVKGGGCSGLEYVIRFETKARDSDLEQTVDSVRFVCDPKSAEFLRGSTLVWTGNLIGGGFQFNNPNAERSCGCGTSFTPRAAKSS